MSVIGIFIKIASIILSLAGDNRDDLFTSIGRANSNSYQPNNNASNVVAQWVCINGHAMSSKSIPSKCPFCGKPMSISR